MSSLILISGTIEDAEDPLRKLDISELYYESWIQDPFYEGKILVKREPVPIRYYGLDQFKLVQHLGSGKTLKGVDILADKVYQGGRVTANMGLVWDNEEKEKEDWVSGVQSLEDLRSLDHCTVLIDDIKGTILRWNVKEADIISEVANFAGKAGLDLIITAQREKMIPPELRDIATDWIVPVIRVRDYTRPTPRNDGYPIEMITLHFDGSKVFKFMSEPKVDLEPLFDAYSTLQRAVSLKKDAVEGARPNQPGYQLEVKAFEFLKEKVPGMEWKHLNGKHVFDIISKDIAIDVCAMDESGDLRTEHKHLNTHIAVARKKAQVPYLMFPYKDSWGFVRIGMNIARRHVGERIDTYHLPIRFIDTAFNG